MMQKLEDLSKEELIKRIRLTAELALAVDGLWFLAAEKAYGYEKALDLDIEVWKRYASVSIKRIKKFISLSSHGLAAIKEIINHDFLWLSIESEFPEETPERLVFQVKNCPALEAMERTGRELLTCEPVEGAYLTRLAEVIDPGIRVKPLKLPPRESTDEICCKWLFSLEGKA